MNSMKKGYTMLNTVLGLLLSLMILDLLWKSHQYVKQIDNHNYNQDILSSLQVYAILNQAQEIIVQPDTVFFEFEGEARSMRYVNHKLIMSPGTVIYYLDVNAYEFFVEGHKIYLKIKRKNKWRIYLIGEL